MFYQDNESLLIRTGKWNKCGEALWDTYVGTGHNNSFLNWQKLCRSVIVCRKKGVVLFNHLRKTEYEILLNIPRMVAFVHFVDRW